MTDQELKNALVTELLNTMPLYKILDLARGFADVLADQQLTDITEEQREALVANFSPPPSEDSEEVAPKKASKKKKVAAK